MPTDPFPPWVLQRRRRLGYRIRALREEREISQEKLGELAGLDRKTVNRIERGARPADVDQLVVLADALHVPVASLFS